MKIRFTLPVLLFPLLLHLSDIQAQNSPQLDPGFLPTAVHQFSGSGGVLQLRDGSRIVGGNFTRAEGQEATGLVRYLPSGAPDYAFNAAVTGLGLYPSYMAESASGKLLVASYTSTAANGPLVQLDATGQPDPAFRMPVQSNLGTVHTLLVQADGKIVIAGNLNFLGVSPVPLLARLLPDGSLDPNFQAQLTTGSLYRVNSLAQQPDGRLVLVADVQLTGGQQPQSRLIRLNTNGQQDASFQPALSATAYLGAVAVQPDGQLLVSALGGQPVLTGGSTSLVRLTASGQPDPGFQAPAYVSVVPFTMMPALAVQSDGKIVLGTTYAYMPGQAPVSRLLPTGALDPSWNISSVSGNSMGYSVQLLPGGQVLMGGVLQLSGSLPRSAAVFDGTGQSIGSFNPRLLENGAMADVAQQPDGRLVAVGSFSEVNGAAAQGIVRFQATGEVDTAFCRQARVLGTARRVLAQPDGTVLLAGNFTAVTGLARTTVARLLPSGAPDPAFTSPFIDNGLGGSDAVELVRRDDGTLLLGGRLLRANNRFDNVVHLAANGVADPTFQAPALFVRALLAQPDGTTIVGTDNQTEPLLRLQVDGRRDPAFNAPTLTTSPFPFAFVNSLARYADGRLLIGGQFEYVGSVATTNVARLLPDGTPDAGFSTQLFQSPSQLSHLALQPNGRILVAGMPWRIPAIGNGSLNRLLPTGATDTTFNSSLGPTMGLRYGTTERILVQADGAIVAAGSFTEVAGLPIGGIARFLDANVLAIRSSTAATTLTAWPVPAHDQLRVSWAGGVAPQRLLLLDALGRPVRTLLRPTTSQVLPTTDLRPGVYLLRAEFASGAPALRRVVIE